eukprot:gene7535-9260_t
MEWNQISNKELQQQDELGPDFNNSSRNHFERVVQSYPMIRDWLFQQYRGCFHPRFGYYYIADAIKKRDLKRLKFYYENYKEYIYNAHHDYLQYIPWDNDKADQDDQEEESLLSIVRYIVENKIGYTSRMFHLACNYGNVKVFEYVFEIEDRNRMKTTSQSQYYISSSLIERSGFLNECTPSIIYHMFQYDKDDRYRHIVTKPVPDYEMTNCFHGDLQLLKFFHEMPNSVLNFTTYSMDRASELGYINIVKFLHFNRTEGCTNLAFFRAALYNHFQVVQFFIENKRDCIDMDKIMNYPFPMEMKNFFKQNHLDTSTIQRPPLMHGKSLTSKSYNELNLFELLENKKNFNVNFEDLFTAAFNGRLCIVRFLVLWFEYKGSVLSSPQDWNRLLNDACIQRGNFEIFNFLISRQSIRADFSLGEIILKNHSIISCLMEFKQIRILRSIVTLQNMDVPKLGSLYMKFNRPSLKLLRLLIEECNLDPNVHINRTELFRKSVKFKKFSIIRYLVGLPNFSWNGVHDANFFKTFIFSSSTKTT